MESSKNTKVQIRYAMNSIAFALCCLACEQRIYDLDRSAPESTKRGWIVRYVMDQDRLYWIEEYQGWPGKGPWGESGHLVMGCEKHDCGATRVQFADLISEGSSSIPPNLSARNNTAYWTESHGLLRGKEYSSSSVTLPDTEVIWRLQAEEDGPMRFFEFPGAAECDSVALDDHDLYCVDNSDSILALSLASDPFPRVVAAAQQVATSPSQFLAHGVYLFWVAPDGSIRRTRKDGTLGVEVIAAEANASSLSIDDNFLYWTDSSANALLRCNPADCTGTMNTLASISSGLVSTTDVPVVPHSLQIEGDSLYWLEGADGGSSSLLRCSVDGCPDGPEVVTPGQMYFYAVDETDAYGVVAAAAPTANAGTQLEIRRFPL